MNPDIKEILITKKCNPFYVQRYLKFINDCNNSNSSISEIGYVEAHHILPRSLFPSASNLKIQTWNSILLTPRQHFIAHWMLSKVFVDLKDRASAIKGFYYMTIKSKCTSERYTSKSFAYARKMHSNSMKEFNPMHNAETRAKMKKTISTIFTPERRARMSQSKMGIPLCDSAKEKLSKFWTGSKRPKTVEHIRNHQSKLSRGDWVTPFGVFTSPGSAAKSEFNIDKLARHTIYKLCMENATGYEFISNGRSDNIGRYPRNHSKNS